MKMNWVDVAIELAFGIGAGLYFGAQVAKLIRQQQGIKPFPSAMDGSLSLLGKKMIKR